MGDKEHKLYYDSWQELKIDISNYSHASRLS
jgi:hypothetical protein